MTIKNKKGCTSCGYFQKTIKYNYICGKKGVEKMMEEKTWVTFNSLCNAGKLFTSFPEWCPKKNQKPKLLPMNTKKKERGAWSISVPVKTLFLPGLWSRFEKITRGEKFTWVNPEYICSSLRKLQRQLRYSRGEGPFVLKGIISYVHHGVTVFVFTDAFGEDARIGSYFFAKWTE